MSETNNNIFFNYLLRSAFQSFVKDKLHTLKQTVFSHYTESAK